MGLDRLDSERLRLLLELSRSFAAHTDLEELVSLVVTRCREAFGVKGGVAVLLLDPATNELYFPYAATADPVYGERIKNVRIPSHVGIAGSVVRSGRSELVPDAQQDPRYFDAVDRAIGFKTGSVIAAPLTTRAGTIGLIYVTEAHGGPVFTQDDLVFLESLAGSVALAIENAQMYGRLRASEEELRSQIGALRKDLERRDRFPEIVGTSQAMRELIRLMESAAQAPIPVLIEGETGTGKELVARGVHRASPRGAKPFLPVNCGALAESTLESELFGHERGAFTDADRSRRGVFEAASGGTIFLDEVEEMSPAMQVKLLRVLQEGEVIPIGSTVGRKVDVRVISASNRSLEAEVDAGRFRADLYYRLAGFPIYVPPLRERREDIPLLIDHLLHLAATSHNKRIGGVTPEAREVLQAFHWPGNVRQLKNELDRAVALAHDGDVIGVEYLSSVVRNGVVAEDAPSPFRDASGTANDARATASGDLAAPSAAVSIEGNGASPNGDTSLRAARARFEASYIAMVLEREGGNVSRAAEVLGLSRVMLHKKLKSLGLR
ncbi:MAG TPA: sigma-54-dependent Fis family transcriptional regulator [Candidatus Binatia bacterium]